MLGAAALLLTLASTADTVPRVTWHDNLHPAGRASPGAVALDLEIRRGMWHPNGDDRAGTNVLAFAVKGNDPTTPGPLVRVRHGTRLMVSVANPTNDTIAVHGLAGRSGMAILDSLVVLPGATVRTAFTADREGTFFYWGARAGTAIDGRAFDDALLNGAFVVDAASGPVPADRILLIDVLVERVLGDSGLEPAGEILNINGRPWPHTERMEATVGDTVRWRLINASERAHPMHLHGFYFRVDAAGDWQQDTVLGPRAHRMTVTENMPPGGTRSITWSPDRPGGWLFHCHLSFHAQMNAPLGAEWPGGDTFFMQAAFGAHNVDAAHHVEHHMGGLMLVTNVAPRNGYPMPPPAERSMRLLITASGDSMLPLRRYGYQLDDGTGAVQPPGPAPLLVFQRDQPTDVVIVNTTPEATSIHWHGIEIDAYSDGVVGVGGYAHLPTPPIMPGDSFVARVKVPRSGSFMYHTHMSDINQQGKGLAGPIVVVDDREAYDSSSERIYLANTFLNFQAQRLEVHLNHAAELVPDTVTAGREYRLRLMNLTLANPGLLFRFVADQRAVPWRTVAKDGFELPPWQQTENPGFHPVSIGETLDVLWSPPPGGSGWLEVRGGGGGSFLRQRVEVVER
jgi:FtsP/CotA-like multicopper oxidase with cupredoxin domain